MGDFAIREARAWGCARTREAAQAYHPGDRNRVPEETREPLSILAAAQVDRTVRIGTVRGSPISGALHEALPRSGSLTTD